MSVNVELREDNENLFKDFQSNYLQEDIIQAEDDDDISLNEPKTFNSIANEDDLLQMYLKDIGKVKLLSSKEEKILGKQIKEGLPQQADVAKRKLIQAKAFPLLVTEPLRLPAKLKHVPFFRLILF